MRRARSRSATGWPYVAGAAPSLSSASIRTTCKPCPDTVLPNRTADISRTIRGDQSASSSGTILTSDLGPEVLTVLTHGIALSRIPRDVWNVLPAGPPLSPPLRV